MPRVYHADAQALKQARPYKREGAYVLQPLSAVTGQRSLTREGARCTPAGAHRRNDRQDRLHAYAQSQAAERESLMWVEEIALENIRCFDRIKISFSDGDDPYRWITLLGENGGGKSTLLQALGLLLAGPEGAQTLVPRPLGWLRDEAQYGKLSVRIHQGPGDPGQFGTKKTTKSFGYSFFVTGRQKITIRNRTYTEPSIQESPEKRLSWLRQHALTSKGTGWFAVGYGPFRRLTRSSQIIVPSLEPAARYTNFATQFNEDQPLSALERWLVYLDYTIAKQKDKEASRRFDIGIDAINHLLPHGTKFDSVSSNGRILFTVGNRKVPTISLSDGYRSILALAGDLVWRLILAFPKSDHPLQQQGVVLIDELDIHLHPSWQRNIAYWLTKKFPKLQFIVATHSPFIASGAGEAALTYRLSTKDGLAKAEQVDNVSAFNVERILRSEAFGLLSPYSPQTQERLDLYDKLKRKKRTVQEDREYQLLLPFIEKARPYGGPPDPGSLDDRIESYLKKELK